MSASVVGVRHQHFSRGNIPASESTVEWSPFGKTNTISNSKILTFHSSAEGGRKSSFTAGFVIGGVVCGVLGFLYAPQVHSTYFTFHLISLFRFQKLCWMNINVWRFCSFFLVKNRSQLLEMMSWLDWMSCIPCWIIYPKTWEYPLQNLLIKQKQQRTMEWHRKLQVLLPRNQQPLHLILE